jgi:hypothetical protein
MSMSRSSSHGFRAILGFVVVALSAGLPGCGGSSSVTGPSNPTPAPPVQTVVQQGTFQLVSLSRAQAAGLPADAARSEFTLATGGKLDVIVDWTFASDPVGFGVYQGSCTFALFYADSCNQVGLAQASTNKPARVTLNNAAAGGYTVVVTNLGANDESGSYQILLTH